MKIQKIHVHKAIKSRAGQETIGQQRGAKIWAWVAEAVRTKRHELKNVHTGGSSVETRHIARSPPHHPERRSCGCSQSMAQGERATHGRPIPGKDERRTRRDHRSDSTAECIEGSNSGVQPAKARNPGTAQSVDPRSSNVDEAEGMDSWLRVSAAETNGTRS